MGFYFLYLGRREEMRLVPGLVRRKGTPVFLLMFLIISSEVSGMTWSK